MICTKSGFKIAEDYNRIVVKVFNVPPNDYDFFSVKTYSGSFKVI